MFRWDLVRIFAKNDDFCVSATSGTRILGPPKIDIFSRFLHNFVRPRDPPWPNPRHPKVRATALAGFFETDLVTPIPKFEQVLDLPPTIGVGPEWPRLWDLRRQTLGLPPTIGVDPEVRSCRIGAGPHPPRNRGPGWS